MLSFTSRGAVASPRTLQIRVGADEPGALRAGAPAPSRDLTDDEIRANIERFTTARDTPRTRPCNRLVLSGLSGRVPHPEVVSFARSHGVERVVLHGRAPALEGHVDAVAVRCRDAGEASGPDHTPWTAIVPLTFDTIAGLDALVAALCVRRPTRVVLSWPFPADEVRLAPLDSAVASARRALEALDTAGLPAVLRGLPPCLDGSDEGRTDNRFYVDADHQLDRALLWVPDVVQYRKPDSCRVCRKSPVCDGVVAAWLDRGVVGPLEPIAG